MPRTAREATFAEDVGLRLRSIAPIALAIHARIPEVVVCPSAPVTAEIRLRAGAEDHGIARTIVLAAKWVVLAAAVTAPWVLLLTS